MFEYTYQLTSSQSNLLSGASQIGCLLLTAIAAHGLYDGILGILFHFSLSTDPLPSISSVMSSSICPAKSSNWTERKVMECIEHTGTAYKENEFCNQNRTLLFCPFHLYSKSVKLNPLNTHPGGSVDANRNALGNIIDSHYGKLSLDTESAIILQSLKRQNYYSFDKRKTQEK